MKARDIDLVVEGFDIMSTYGGEYHDDSYDHSEYGLQIGDVSIGEFTPTQFKKLAITMMNHLITNGHTFEFYEDFGQYLREK